MDSNDKQVNWYYAEKGKQVGPVNIEDIKNLISNEKINLDTKVWSGGRDWKQAKDTELSELFSSQNTPSIPPPLTGNDIDNKFIWAIVAVPVIGIIIKLITGVELALFYIIANIICCALDENKLEKAGQESPARWAVFLIPVYLWKRATLLKQARHYFWIWCAAFIISIFVGFGGNHSAIEEAARPVVTQIIQRQPFVYETCKSVKIIRKASDGFYTATATLSNGKDIRIAIEITKAGYIYVTIPNQ